DLVAELVHRDEPLVDKTEDELGAAAPAGRIAVGVVLNAVEPALLAQALEDLLGHVAGKLAGEEAEGWALQVVPFLLQPRDRGQVEGLGEREVLSAGSRCDVDDAGALGVADVVPLDHAVDDALLRRQLVERA